MSSTAQRSPADAARSTTKAGGGHAFRPDVEGLRAIAVGLVLLYHARVDRLAGGFIGVDVFFVISGFLITGLLIRELESTGRVSLTQFYGRRAKRLLPATGVVLAAAAAMTLAFVPIVDRRDFGGDTLAAAMYVLNWRLAGRAVNYLAEDSGLSPVQHFWSLAVEEQFYIVWPLLILAVAWWMRRSGWSLRVALGVGLSAIALPSFAWSVYQTSHDPSRAFFVSTTRMWELAIGAAAAIAIPWLGRIPRRLAIATGWLGLITIVVAGMWVSASMQWPGYLALVPTLGTAAVIAAGPSAGRAGPVALLGTRAFVWVGGLSYSLYLWHWPMVVAAAAHWGGLSTRRGLVVVTLSVIPAWLTHRLVENPFRYSVALSRFPRRALAVGAAFTLVGVTAGLTLLLTVPKSRTSGPGGQRALGAAVLTPAPSDRPAGGPTGGPTGATTPEASSTPTGGTVADTAEFITPDPLQATKDIPEAYARGCQVNDVSSKPVSCVFGSPKASTTVALVGDSKALQWLPALDAIGKQRGWKVVTWTKSACVFADADILLKGRRYDSCSEWNTRVLEKLAADPPDLVVTSQASGAAIDEGGGGKATMVSGLERRWRAMNALGSKVAVLQDNQHPGMRVYECVAENRNRLSRCAFKRGESGSAPVLRKAVAGVPGVTMLDLTDAICPTSMCPPVIGNVLVYRQGSHLTATYVKTLTPRLETLLAKVL